MSDGKVFLDSNVLVYLFSEGEPKKRQQAADAIAAPDCYTGTNNINETMTVLRKKYRKSFGDLNIAVETLEELMTIVPVEPRIVRPALRIMDRYGFSYYDSLVVALALKTDCSRLYTEDLHHGQVIDGTLTITNIFQ